MPAIFSRRDFLKLGLLSAACLGFRSFPPGGDPDAKRPATYALGRTIYSLRHYERPSFSSRETGYYITDAVVNIHEQRVGDPKPVHNPIWLRTDEGWLHSAYVQPVKRQLNQPVLKVPPQGMLVEVTVPFTQAYRIIEGVWKRSYRFYYASTYWAFYAFPGVTGEIWYQIIDDKTRDVYVVKAEDLRPVTAEELEPISPGVSDKLIEVDLDKQRLVAYENQRPVFTTRIATGYFEGNTPRGEFRVERKQPSRHMATNMEGNGAPFDLPGVPWVSYISWTGVSIHGTYWHHNYGTPQSHGCINLPPEAAKWIYRWSEPFVPVEEDYVETKMGTRVVVF